MLTCEDMHGDQECNEDVARTMTHFLIGMGQYLRQPSFPPQRWKNLYQKILVPLGSAASFPSSTSRLPPTALMEVVWSEKAALEKCTEASRYKGLCGP